MKTKLFLSIVIISLLTLAVFVFVSAQTRIVTHQFYKGWNLVYGFGEPSQLDGQALDKQHIKAIYAYLPTVQKYFRLYPEPEDTAEGLLNKYGIDDADLLQTALWVYSDTTQISGYQLLGDIEPLNSRQIYKGWNFISLSKEDLSKYTFNEISGTCDITRTFVFDPTGLAGAGSWDEEDLFGNWKFNEKMPSLAMHDDFEVVIKVIDNCKMGISGSIPPVPQLPQ